MRIANSFHRLLKLEESITFRSATPVHMVCRLAASHLKEFIGFRTQCPNSTLSRDQENTGIDEWNVKSAIMDQLLKLFKKRENLHIEEDNEQLAQLLQKPYISPNDKTLSQGINTHACMRRQHLRKQGIGLGVEYNSHIHETFYDFNGYS